LRKVVGVEYKKEYLEWTVLEYVRKYTHAAGKQKQIKSANLKEKFNDQEFFTVAELYVTHN